MQFESSPFVKSGLFSYGESFPKTTDYVRRLRFTVQAHHECDHGFRYIKSVDLFVIPVCGVTSPIKHDVEKPVRVKKPSLS